MANDRDRTFIYARITQTTEVKWQLMYREGKKGVP